MNRRLVDQALRALGPMIESGPHRLAVGIDIVDLVDFTRILDSALGKPFLDRAYVQPELDYCGDNIQRLGGRWAAKEAVSKAIGTGFRLGLNPRDIVILHEDDGAPLLRPREGAIWPNGSLTWDWSISIAHEQEIAIAVAIARPGGDHARQ